MRKYLILMASVILLLVSVNTSSAASYADIAFVIDQSGSMGGEFRWLGNSINAIDTSIKDAGITARYGLAGYEDTTGTEYSGNAWVDLTSDINAIVNEVDDVSTYGGTEEGYQAADWAVNNFSWSGGNYLKVMILITDENSDNSSNYIYGGGTGETALAQMINDNNILLNVITLENLYDVWDGAVFTRDDPPGGPIEYLGLFNLDYLRTNPSGFTSDFVDAKIQEIQNTPPVPIPGAVWLLSSGLVGIVGLRRKMKK